MFKRMKNNIKNKGDLKMFEGWIKIIEYGLAVKIDAGYLMACPLGSDGSVKCWNAYDLTDLVCPDLTALINNALSTNYVYGEQLSFV